MPTEHRDIRRPWSRSDRPVPRTVLRPFQEFVATSTAAGIALFAAIVIALVWANSPWQASYEQVWHTSAAARTGGVHVEGDLRFWIQDGLMTFFFLLVGLEIKREFVTGDLRDLRAAALPAVAALGGMAAPALMYLAIVGSGEAQRGWAIPIATDVALALGVLALAASAAPSGLKPLLLTLAIVDDIGAIVVIAIFYPHGGDLWYLAAAAAAVAVIAAGQHLYIRATWFYLFLGLVLWYAFYRSGVHPTIAGVILGLLTPARPFQRPAAVSAEAKRTANETMDEPNPPDADAGWWLRLSWLSREAVSPLAQVEHTLLPWTSFVIVPLFALANAGVTVTGSTLRAAFNEEIGLGIIMGLVVGKPLGIYVAGRVAIGTRVATMPADVGWRDFIGMGASAGVGFTVALFIAELAFASDPSRLATAKVAILVASLVAGVGCSVILRSAAKRKNVGGHPHGPAPE